MIVEEAQLALDKLLQVTGVDGSEMHRKDAYSADTIEGSTNVLAYPTVLSTVARMTSRAFIGAPECRDPEWLRTAEGYTGDVFAVSTDLRPYPKMLRPIVALFLDSKRRLRSHVQVAQRKLVPLLQERNASRPSEKDGRMDLLQWMTDTAQGEDRDPRRLAMKMLFLTLAAIHTSSMGATHALFDLCANPGDAGMLREEIKTVLYKEGWSITALNQMRKLDSFMKESQRVNHPGLCRWHTTVIHAAWLSLTNGTV